MAVQTEWLEKDYYKVLGVPETADEKEIQRAYRRLARKYHPDANPADPGAEERFKEVSAAYEVVGDAEKRREYDELRRLGPMAGGFGVRTGPGEGRRGGFEEVRIEDLGDFTDLGDLFGGFFGGGRRGGAGATGPIRGRDVEAELQLTFEQAVFGLTTEVTVTGEGREARGIKVRIPAGVDDGQMVRLSGQGEPGRSGGRPGDLFVRVRVAPHPVFGRDRSNLTVKVPVTYPEAVLGAEIKVPTLEGGPVIVRIPPGTPSGRVLRVKGHGVARAGGGRGDLLVTVEVAVPRRPSEAERAAVEALAAVTDQNPRAHLGV